MVGGGNPKDTSFILLCPILQEPGLVWTLLYVIDLNLLYPECLRTSKDTTDWQQRLYAACPSEECSSRVVSENRPLYDSIQPVLIAYSPLRSAFCRSCGEWDVKNHTGWGLCFQGTGRKQKDTGRVGSGLWGKMMPTAMLLVQCFPVISASK